MLKGSRPCSSPGPGSPALTSELGLPCPPQGAFPARLKKVFIVGAPVWFRVPYNLLSLLLKEKLRERVSSQSVPVTGAVSKDLGSSIRDWGSF